MKRFLVFLLMCLLPYQMTLAAVMGIEMEAPTAAVQTAGEEAPCHHAGDVSMADQAATDAGHAAHGHCGFCHFAGGSALPVANAPAAPLPAAQAPLAHAGTQLPAPPAARPERPKWGSLA